MVSNRGLMKTAIKIILHLLVCVTAILISCHNESNPAVPGAPEVDVITIVERNQMIRVGLLSFTPQKNIYISSTRGEFKVFADEGLMEFGTGISGETMKFTGGDDVIEFTDVGADEGRDLVNKIVRVELTEYSDDAYILVGTSKDNLRPYRGKLLLKLEGKNILVWNELPLEEYLQGVVPAEMDLSWPEEALRAQAVVSRSYALFNIDRYGNRGFDVADDERSQKYGGVSVESPETTEAVLDTQNQVVMFRDRLAVVVFHEESGGLTASSLDVWPRSTELSYLMPVSDVVGDVDFSADGNYESWSNWASHEDIHAGFNMEGEVFVGEYFSTITILGTSDTGRVQMIDIIGEKDHVVTAMSLAYAMNRRLGVDFLPSNKFELEFENDGYRFTGSGRGHGVGMSQWGAYQRALYDQDYREIIGTYFPACDVVEIPTDGIEVVHNTKLDQIR